MTMDCERTQAAILASFDARGDAVVPEVATHVKDCPVCAQFASAQAAIDGRLSASLRPAPAMSGDFRRSLHASIARERVPAWGDGLPDIVHFASWGAATVLCVVFVPMNPTVIALGGVTAALLTYVALTVARSAIEDAEPGW